MRPLAPIAIERMRVASGPRDATLISVLAYAGRQPGGALGLRWGDIYEQTVLIERAISLGEERDTKTAAHRTVRLLPALAADLREWRLRSGRPRDSQLVFPSITGSPWTLPAYQSWRRRAFRRGLEGAGGSSMPVMRGDGSGIQLFRRLCLNGCQGYCRPSRDSWSKALSAGR